MMGWMSGQGSYLTDVPPFAGAILSHNCLGAALAGAVTAKSGAFVVVLVMMTVMGARHIWLR